MTAPNHDGILPDLELAYSKKEYKDDEFYLRYKKNVSSTACTDFENYLDTCARVYDTQDYEIDHDMGECLCSSPPSWTEYQAFYAWLIVRDARKKRSKRLNTRRRDDEPIPIPPRPRHAEPIAYPRREEPKPLGDVFKKFANTGSMFLKMVTAPRLDEEASRKMSKECAAAFMDDVTSFVLDKTQLSEDVKRGIKSKVGEISQDSFRQSEQKYRSDKRRPSYSSARIYELDPLAIDAP